MHTKYISVFTEEDGYRLIVPTDDDTAGIDAVCSFESWVSQDDHGYDFIVDPMPECPNMVRVRVGRNYSFKEQTKQMLSLFESFDRQGLAKDVVCAVYSKFHRETRFYAWSENAYDVIILGQAPRICEHTNRGLRDVYGVRDNQSTGPKKPKKTGENFYSPKGLSLSFRLGLKLHRKINRA